MKNPEAEGGLLGCLQALLYTMKELELLAYPVMSDLY